MVEGPMNIEPKPVEIEVETTQDAGENIDKQKTGLTDIAPVDVAPGATAHFPTHKPRLHAGGQATLKALRGR